MRGCTAGHGAPMLYFRPHAGKNLNMEVKLAVLADYANISQNGKLNIMGIFQEVHPPGLPFQLPQMYLVVSFEAGAAEFGSLKDIRFALLDSDGDEMLALEGQATVPRPDRAGSRAYINEVIGLNGIAFERPGDYGFSILVQGETKGVVELHVNEPLKEADDDGTDHISG